MASENLRWRNIREFLDDLPREHCQIKPGHEYCTVCMRINYIIASSCPLFHQIPVRKPRRESVHEEVHTDPIKEHVTSEDIKHALKGEDFPIIEFAGPRGTGTKTHDDEVFDVEPIDVEPVADPPAKADVKPKEKPPKRAPVTTEEPEEEGAKPKPDRDPESIVQEIMEELEFPDEAELDEEESDEVELDEEGEEPPVVDQPDDSPPDGPPPKVKKEAVKKLRPRD